MLLREDGAMTVRELLEESIQRATQESGAALGALDEIGQMLEERMQRLQGERDRLRAEIDRSKRCEPLWLIGVGAVYIGLLAATLWLLLRVGS